MPVFEEWRVAGLCSRRVRVRVWKVASPRPAHLDSDYSGRNYTSRTRIGFINATAASLSTITASLSCIAVSLLHVAATISHIDIFCRAEQLAMCKGKL